MGRRPAALTIERRLGLPIGVDAADYMRRRTEARSETAIRQRGRAPAGTNPTLRELEVLLAILEHSGYRGAADALGLSVQTVKNQVSTLLIRVEAKTFTHAVWLCWPIIEDLAAIPSTRHPDYVWNGKDRRYHQRRRFVPKPAAH